MWAAAPQACQHSRTERIRNPSFSLLSVKYDFTVLIDQEVPAIRTLIRITTPLSDTIFDIELKYFFNM